MNKKFAPAQQSSAFGMFGTGTSNYGTTPAFGAPAATVAGTGLFGQQGTQSAFGQQPQPQPGLGFGQTATAPTTGNDAPQLIKGNPLTRLVQVFSVNNLLQLLHQARVSLAQPELELLVHPLPQLRSANSNLQRLDLVVLVRRPNRNQLSDSVRVPFGSCWF